MNKNAEKWIEALRSGSYKQTQRKLRDEYGFCCLGVACDVYRRETGHGKWIKWKQYSSFATDLHEDVNVLPESVREWLGLRSINTTYMHGSLVRKNDLDESSFDEIADIIEKEPPGLFRGSADV